MVACEFYRLDSTGKSQVIGVLPERRKYPERLTEESIKRWGQKYFSQSLDAKDIFFIQVTIDDTTGKISRPTPFFIHPKEILK